MAGKGSCGWKTVRRLDKLHSPLVSQVRAWMRWDDSSSVLSLIAGCFANLGPTIDPVHHGMRMVVEEITGKRHRLFVDT